MTEDQIARLRRGFEAIIRLVRGNGDPGLAVNTADPYYPAISVYDAVKIGNHPLPELEAKDHLALSVLLGEPDGVVLSALCDLLIEQGHEYAVECFRKGVESVNPFSEMVKAMTPAMSQYTAAMAELGRRVAEMLAVSASVTNDAQPT